LYVFLPDNSSKIEVPYRWAYPSYCQPTKDAGHFTRGAGGYFAGMARKAERGELRLERSLWALREAKWGKSRDQANRLLN
jgi:hypothetical protein